MRRHVRALPANTRRVEGRTLSVRPALAPLDAGELVSEVVIPAIACAAAAAMLALILL